MVPSERILLNGLPARRLSLSDFGFLYPLAAPPADSRSQISDFFIPWRRRAPRSLTRRRRRFLFSEIRLPMAVGPIELRGLWRCQPDRNGLGIPARRLSLSDFGFLYPLAAPPPQWSC